MASSGLHVLEISSVDLPQAPTPPPAWPISECEVSTGGWRGTLALAYTLQSLL